MREDSLEEAYRLRQQDIAPVERMRSRPIHVIGAGGIGSNLCLMVAKMGCDIVVYDGDVVAPENVNAQLFGPGHLGRPKTEVVQELCVALAGAQIKAVNAFVAGGEPVSGVVVEAVDSQETRRHVFEEVVVPRAPFVDAFISLRMGAETGTMISIQPDLAKHRIWYEAAALYTDAQAMPLPCTGRAIAYSCHVAAALAARQIKRVLMRQQPLYRRVEFDLDTLMFVVEE